MVLTIAARNISTAALNSSISRKPHSQVQTTTEIHINDTSQASTQPPPLSSTPTPPFKYHVLISGAGPSGLVLAWWLSRHGIRSTIIERSPHLRAAGQTLDLEGPSLKIIEKMGLLPQFQARKTHEAGLLLVDENNHAYAKVPMNDGVSLTKDIEVLRGDMVQIWYQELVDDPNVSFMFGDRIASVDQTPTTTSPSSQLKIGLKSGGVLKGFDLLVVADGMNSKTRELVFNDDHHSENNEDPVHGLGCAIAFFSIPWQESDANWARFYSTAGRQALLRPHPPSGTVAALGMTKDEAADYMKLDIPSQKQLLHKAFAHVGWEAPRMLAAMDDAADFYMAEIAQVKCKRWHKGRVALIGDAAHCSSPVTGVGLTLSIVGAYVLANELGTAITHAASSSHSSSSFSNTNSTSIASNADTTVIETAFTNYEAKLRPYVEQAQTLPPGMPGFVCPKSSWGVRLFRATTRVLLARPVMGALSKSAAVFGGGESGKKEFELPSYTQAVAA